MTRLVLMEGTVDWPRPVRWVHTCGSHVVRKVQAGLLEATLISTARGRGACSGGDGARRRLAARRVRRAARRTRGKEADAKAEERPDVTRWSGARTLGRRCARHVS